MKPAYSLFLPVMIFSCSLKSEKAHGPVGNYIIRPVYETERVLGDTDDPAIWINDEDPKNSLIIGTDKGDEGMDGGLYAFDIKGRKIKSVLGLKRPNNVDVGYDFYFGDSLVDIAVVTERYSNRIRVFLLPDLIEADDGGIPVFENDSLRSPMGIALYRSTAGDKMYAIVSRKNGPRDRYLHQYMLSEDNSVITGSLVRKFGKFSGLKEIESIAVDNELGYVYYSDEGVGIRKYYAAPDSSSEELALFGQKDFAEDMEGISIYKFSEKTGYILISDQQSNAFNIYRREGDTTGIHDHGLLKKIFLSTSESDGSDITNVKTIEGFPYGFFAAMSDNKTFQIYKTEEILGLDLLR